MALSALDFTKPIALTGLFKTNIRAYLKGKGATVQPCISLRGQLLTGFAAKDGTPVSTTALYRLAQAKGVPIFSEKDAYVGAPTQLLVDKYKPRTLADVIGHTEQIRALRDWLATGTATAALITGPPGIGKTTVAHLIAAEAGYRVVEYNASDVRSASAVTTVLGGGGGGLTQKELVIMDEVDGMSGSDRGGIGALADYIKKGDGRRLICIANERSAPKMRPLLNCCLDVPFSRPAKTIIARSLATIAAKEGIAIPPSKVQEMCEQGGNDIRAILNTLQFTGARATTSKEVTLNMFSATLKLYGYEGRSASLDDALRFVSTDYMMVPLMVAEGAAAAAAGNMDAAAAAAERASFGDMLERRLVRHQEWSLLPDYMTNTVAISRLVPGAAPPAFPIWLGKNSVARRRQAQLGGLGSRSRLGAEAKRLDLLPGVTELIRNAVAGGDAKEVVALLRRCRLSRDDFFEAVQDIVLDPVAVPTKLKGAITREATAQAAAGKSKKRGKAAATATKAKPVQIAALPPEPENEDADSAADSDDEVGQDSYI
jgi:replication factor C subunit 1